MASPIQNGPRTSNRPVARQPQAPKPAPRPAPTAPQPAQTDRVTLSPEARGAGSNNGNIPNLNNMFQTQGQTAVLSGDTSGQFKVNGPLGLKIEGSGSGNAMLNGAEGNLNGGFTRTPNGGFTGTLGGSGFAGSKAEGQTQITVGGLPFGSTFNGAIRAKASSGAGGSISEFSNPATAPKPGTNPGQAEPAKLSVPNDGSGVDLDGETRFFGGNQLELTTGTRLDTPIGSLGNETTVRAANGVGGHAGGQFTTNKDEATFGWGAGFEAGASTGVKSTNTLTTPGGSSFSQSGNASAGGMSADFNAGISRNNKTQTTSFGLDFGIPIPETSLTAGGGGNVTIHDNDVKTVGNALSPGAGDTAVVGLQTVPALVDKARTLPNETVQAGADAAVDLGRNISEDGRNTANRGADNLVKGMNRGGFGGTVQAAKGTFDLVTGEAQNLVGNTFQEGANFGRSLWNMATPPWWKAK